MTIENTVDKVKLIADLKEIHRELFEIYKDLFDFKYKNDDDFKIFIDNEYKDNGVSNKDVKSWNDNFCHRASYTLLNKILFVRICEDKGFMLNDEDYIAGEKKDPDIGKKLSKKGLQKWNNLITNYTLGELVKFAFNDMKKSYSNIILYKEDKYEILNPTDEELAFKYIGGNEDIKNLILAFEKVLEDVIEKLDTNKFNFKYTDGNILGDVYEKFMDRETRKAIGQFYTPEFVIEYILKNTVEEADVLENPFVTVADISCGSGHFLIMAYDILKEKFLNNLENLREKYAEETYKIKKNGVETEVTGKEYWVKENIHYHILKHCIYGADLDSFAVQLTTINLLLKDLDNFTDEINIIECDSLIKWEEDYDWKDLKEQLKEEFEVIVTTQSNLFGEEEKIEIKQRKENYRLRYKDFSGIEREEIINREKVDEILRMCEFWDNGFDYAVGNPPYITVGGKYTEVLENNYEEYLNNKYRYSNYKMNTYILFYERIIYKTRKSGKISFITPRAILDNYYFENFREFLIDNMVIETVVEIKDKIFDSAETGGNAVIVLKNECNKKYDVKLISVTDSENFSNEENRMFFNSIDSFRKNPNYRFLLNEESKTFLLDKIKINTVPLDEVCDIKNGVNTGNVADILLSKEKKDDRYIPIIEGKDINRYKTRWGGLFICYDSTLKQSIDISQLKTKQNKIDFALRSKDIFDKEKIVIRQTGDKLIADLDVKKMITRHSVHVISLKQVENLSLYYILCLLNSELINFYYQSIIPEKGKAFAEVKIVNLVKLPINISDVGKVNKISDYGMKLKKLFQIKLELENKFDEILQEFDIENLKTYLDDEAEVLGKIELCYEFINMLIYDLYGIDKQNIKYIKETFGNKLNEEIYQVFLLGNNQEIINKNEIELEEKLTYEKFYKIHIVENMNLEEMANKYQCSLIALANMRKKYSNKNNSRLELYNLTEVIVKIFVHFNEIFKVLMNDNGNYLKLKEIKGLVSNKYKYFDKVIECIRRYDSPIKKSEDFVKEALNTNVYTWNAYRKDLDKDKVNKTFVKYYDTNYYGLTEWSDEIHKKYFMDAIEEYTVSNPNEKKAKDILKLFKDLNIEDKEDYIDIIEGKINKAFK